MNRFGTLVVVGALLLLGPGTALADPKPTFDSCEDAFNFGSNSAHQWVSSVMNRAGCDGDVATAEIKLAKALEKQKIPPHNPKEHKVCFYQGLYAGYVATLESEVASCGRWLSLDSAARAALSVFGAMARGLGKSLDSSNIDQVFDGVYDASGQDANTCSSFIFVGGAEYKDELCDDGEPCDELNARLNDLASSVCWNN